MDGAPYGAVLQLLGWAADHFAELDGVCLLRGVDLLSLPLVRYLNVVAALILQDVSSDEERAKLAQMFEYDDVGGPTTVDYMTPERWGTSREAIANVQAAMSLADAHAAQV